MYITAQTGILKILIAKHYVASLTVAISSSYTAGVVGWVVLSSTDDRFCSWRNVQENVNTDFAENVYEQEWTEHCAFHVAFFFHGGITSVSVLGTENIVSIKVDWSM